MATTTFYMSPITLLIQIFSNIGIPLQGGFVAVYRAGTTTPTTTYTDSTGSVPNSNPIPLSPAGRLQTAGNAPTTVWLPAGVAHKAVITDSAGNFILGLDNLTALADPTAILALLATVSTSSVLGGADLVANAVRSYDVIASVRAAQVPSLSAGQTLVIDVEGGALINDGNGGIFYWSATSTATDDGKTVIQPTAVVGVNPGRYLRQTNLYGTAGTFNLTVTGCTTAPTVVATYVQNGNQVTLSIADTGNLTSNSTGFGFSGMANGLQGATQQANSPLIAAVDNSALGQSAYFIVPTVIGGSNLIIVNNNTTGNWTASGQKRLFQNSFTYLKA